MPKPKPTPKPKPKPKPNPNLNSAGLNQYRKVQKQQREASFLSNVVKGLIHFTLRLAAGHACRPLHTAPCTLHAHSTACPP